MHVCIMHSFCSTDDTQFLSNIIQQAEKGNCLFKIRFSTVLCIGLPKAGKTSFCNLLMGKSTDRIQSGKAHTIFIKRPNPNATCEEPKWTEINFENVTEIIDQLNTYKATPVLGKDNEQRGILNSGEQWEVLLLLDYNIPASALCLLQPSLVTFVTYKMLGQDFSFSDSYKFIKSKSSFPRFVKELLSCSCVKRESKFHELEISNDYIDNKKIYTAFVGVLNDNSSQKFYENEAVVINKSLDIVKEQINCSPDHFPLSFWYVNDDAMLHLVNLDDKNNECIKSIRDSLDEVIDQSTAYKIPITWAVFYFKVYKLCLENERTYAYYDEVLESIWKGECNNYHENELKLTLSFFHNLGMLFYFDIEGMKDYVFTNCHWIYKKLNYLLGDFKDSKRDLYAKKVLKCEGKLLYKMIKEIKFEGPGDMKLHTFVNLLQHLKYIAPLNQHGYFMPSILQSYEDSPEVFTRYGSSHSLPLLITFSSGSLHRSVFCYLAAYIMNIKQWEKLKIRKQPYTFKDLITFSVDVDQYMCIIDKVFFLEIKLYSKTNGDNSSGHNSVFTLIQSALVDVCGSLQLSFNDCRYGFQCCACEGGLDNHVMVVEEYKSDKDASCCKTNETKKLSSQHTIWFPEVCN